MKIQSQEKLRRAGNACRTLLVACASATMFLALLAAPPAQAAITWDSQAETSGGNPAGSGTQWWFDPFNWSAQDPADDPPYFLPPSNESGTGVTDTQINRGTTTLPGGEGVVYDPSSNDPNWDDVQELDFPPGFGLQILNQLYISRNVPFDSAGALTDSNGINLLTIKGDIQFQNIVIVGRSGSREDPQNPGQYIQNEGRINQESGFVNIPNSNLDLGNFEASGWGNGIYDYRGGILEVALSGGNGVRIAHGSSSGTGGHGRFIMRNPGTDGRVRIWDFNVASHASGIEGQQPDGVIRGVGTVEFHFANGGTRPIQVERDLIINNGMVTNGIRSARLELVLDEAPMVDIDGIPIDLGLFDVTRNIIGAGNLGTFFSSADGTTLYDQDAIVSATFGSSIYNWTISYTGQITWADRNNSVIASIDATGGNDVVLIGHSSDIAPGLPGDHNGDGVVDAADYVLWRKTNIDGQQGYDDWRENFGMSLNLGSGAGLSFAAVPEPGALALALVAVFGAALLRRRR